MYYYTAYRQKNNNKLIENKQAGGGGGIQDPDFKADSDQTGFQSFMYIVNTTF